MTTELTEPSLDQRRLDLEAEIIELRRRLGDAEDTLDAITGGRVDALVVGRAADDERRIVLLEGPPLDDHLLIDRLAQGAVLLSRSGEVLHVNSPFLGMVGTSVEALLGRPYSEFIHATEHGIVSELLDGTAACGTADITLTTFEGKTLRAHVTCVPFADANGVCLIVTGIDADWSVEEARATVRALHQGEVDAVVVTDDYDEPRVLLLGAAGRRYRYIVEHMLDGAITLSARGDVLYVNPRAAAMLGVAPGDVVGRRLTDFLEPRDHALVDALLDGRRGSGSQAELTLRGRDGVPFLALLTPVPPADDHGVSLILRDLSYRQRLDEAEETLRAIGSGEVDAFVVARAEGDEIEMLSAAHRPYRVMVERMQQGAVTLSATGEILYTNQPLATMLGRPLTALIGTRLSDLVIPADRALLEALLDTPQGSASQGELTLLHGGGAYVPALVSVALLPEEGGICLIVTDLTAQKAYEAIVAAQTLERSILDQAIDAIVLCDLEGRVTRASRAAFDLASSNPLLQPFNTAFPLDSDDGRPDLRAVMSGAVTLRGREFTLRRRGVPDATVLLSAGPIVDADGAARSCVVTMSDITERRHAEDRLRESDRHKDEFLAILAHELRNPLAPIRSAVELLRASELASQPNASKAVEIIGRQTQNLIRLVDDLLDINRIGQGKIVLQLADIDMRRVVEQAIEMCRPLITSRKHQLDAQLPNEAIPVRGDFVRLSQVVVNLLTNAAHYTPTGGRIELTLETTHGTSPQAVVRVTDNGVGIPAEMVARIFEPYQQATQARERSTGGLGLGLTVSRRLMEMHGGTVEAFSEGAGRGSTFVTRLALAQQPGPPATTSQPEFRRGTKLRVLIVDDNRDAAETLGQLLTMIGHDVRALTSGAEAIDEAMEWLPNVVLLDIGMPGMDGYEVARRLRESPGGDDLRLIAMTGYGSSSDRRRSIESGIDHHLVKPVDFAALQNLLANC